MFTAYTIKYVNISSLIWHQGIAVTISDDYMTVPKFLPGIVGYDYTVETYS